MVAIYNISINFVIGSIATRELKDNEKTTWGKNHLPVEKEKEEGGWREICPHQHPQGKIPLLQENTVMQRCL